MISLQFGKTNELIAALHDLPQDWQLTPLGKRDLTGKPDPKAPYLKQWSTTDIDRPEIEREIRSGRAIGFGLKLGGDLVAIDFDGQSAIDYWVERFGAIPETITWTSGKDGRFQALFTLPLAIRERVKPKKISTGTAEQLEFRYTGHQSVLPPSSHPETDGYVWLNSPTETVVAELPQIVIDHWLELIEPKPRSEISRQPKPINTAVDIPPIPLENCLAKSNRESLNGVHQGGRNDSGYKLACDLIGCAKYLNFERVAFEGDPFELFDRFASGCTPPLSDRESDNIWRSAQA